MSEEFLCARCARHQRTCCQDTEVFVTQGDIRRIEPHADEIEFAEFRAPSDPIYDQSVEDPYWHHRVFQPDGTRRVLKQSANGNCIFLGMQGCVLPEDARPLVCRLYPFDYTFEGILPRLASGCPTELLNPSQSLLTELGMSEDNAKRLHAQLYQEICET